MKKIIFILSIISFLIFTSCENNDNDNENYSIIGTWKYTSSNTAITKTRTFSNDNTCVYNFVNIDGQKTYEATIEGTYGSNGSKLTLTFLEEGESKTNAGNYSINDNELTLTIDDEFTTTEENGPTVYSRQ